MVRLRSPLLMLGTQKVPLMPEHDLAAQLTRHHRRHVLKRSIGMEDYFDLTKNSPTYTYSIGVPRGVPNENIPVVSAPITANKNVDQINFVNYNVLRLSNLTRDAGEGLAEQFGPTSLMTVQNCMAMDMLLAKKEELFLAICVACSSPTTPLRITNSLAC